MKDVVGVTFQEDGRISYYLVGKNKVKNGYNVIVKTSRGLEFAKIVTEIHPMDITKLKEPLTEIYKMATKEDYYTHKENIKLANLALKKCRQLVEKYN